MHLFEFFSSSALAQAFGWTLFHSLWQGLFWVLVLSLSLRYISRQKAQQRYAVSLLCLVGLFISSLGTFVYEYQLLSHSSFSLALGDEAQIIVNSPQLALAEGTGVFESLNGQINKWSAYLPYFSMIWILGVCFFSVKWMGSWIYLQDIRKNSTEAKYKWQSWVDELAYEMKIRRYVSLRESSHIQSPMVIGHLKPIILLPLGMLTQMSPAQLEAIFAHELAHIRRHDFLVNLLQSLMEIVFFYHPAQWWISNQIRDEREHCCDDSAVHVCGDPLAYAKALAELEEMRMIQNQLAPALLGRKSQLLFRIKRLMNPEIKETTGGSRVYMMALLMLGMSAMVLANPGYAKNKVENLIDVLLPEAEEEICEEEVLAVLAEEEKQPGLKAKLADVRIEPIEMESLLEMESLRLAEIDLLRNVDLAYQIELAVVNDTPPPAPPAPPVPPVPPVMKNMPAPPAPPSPPVPMIGSFDPEDSVAMRKFELQMEKFSKEMEVWGEKYGKQMEEYGKKMEVWSQSMEKDWAKWEKEYEMKFHDWEKKYGKDWEKWGEEFGKNWEKWIEEHEHQFKNFEDMDEEEREELKEEMRELREEARRLHQREQREMREHQREHIEELREEMSELRERVRAEQMEAREHAEESRREAMDARREIEREVRAAQREARLAEREAMREMEQAERGRERAERISNLLTEELVEDGIIKKGAKKLSVKISAKEMHVNGKKLSDAQFKKYVELMESNGVSMPKGNSRNSYVIERN